MQRWTLHYSQKAIQAIYRIQRGPAARITDAIKSLAVEPHPPGSQALERTGTYFLSVEEQLVVYEVSEDEGVIRILRIE